MDDVLRKAIRQSKRTHYSLAKQAGMQPSVIDRFMAGRDINVATAGKLTRIFDLRLVPKQGSKK
jgi:hypothetical protein